MTTQTKTEIDNTQNDETCEDHPQTGPEVTVSIDGPENEKTIKRGSWIVSELKTFLGIGEDMALSVDIDGTLTPLADDKRITIKGCEVFFSGARTGGAS